MESSRLVCLLVTVLVFSEGCGGDDDVVSSPPETKVVGGGEVDIKDFPYQVYLRTSFSACGGVIISDRWVLTAAHCTVGKDPSSMKIRVGTNDRDSGGDVYGVEEVVIHPQYLRSRDFDISAVKSSAVIQFNRSLGVDKVLLPPESGAELPSVDTTLNVTGWGRVSENGTSPHLLKGAVSSVVNFSNCDAGGCFPRDGNLTLCLKPATGGPCYGDSGGPVTRNNVLYGLVSGGIKPCGSAAWVTSVVAFRGWIKDVTRV